MKFGEIPVASATGAILAHGVRAEKLVFKKGRRLSGEDVAALSAAGKTHVIAAQLEPGDVPEDEAAASVAASIAGENLVTSAAFTGRCNLFANVRGIAVIDTARLDRLNLVDEAITIATLPAFAPVEPRQMIATVKIIPFAAPKDAVERCKAIAAEAGKLVRIAPYLRRRVGLIQTRLPGTKPSVLASTETTTGARIAAMGSELSDAMIVDHRAEAVAEAVADLKSRGCDPILVLGASAIVDRRDVIPAAIVARGGEVLHFGMPVDPGNLLLLGRVESTTVLGLPGCARSPKLNGFDWVLQRILAGLEVTRTDIMRMGAGGLLAEIPSRPLPRVDAAPEPGAGIPRAPHIAAVVLAAGRSSRMAPANKLLTEVEGRAMVVRAVEAALASQARPVIVVTGHDGGRVREALKGKHVVVVENPDFASGLSSSVKAGLAALPSNVDGALFMLGDMPRVTEAHLDRLIAAFSPVEGRAICVPTHRAKRGNPVLWARRFFADMQSLSGDAGARTILNQHAEQICEVEMADDGVLLDVDTPEALAALRDSGQKASA
jgi:molybdenum cofactor cytidylyltransferase